MYRKQASLIGVFVLCTAVGQWAWHQQALKARYPQTSVSLYDTLPGQEAVLGTLDQTVKDGLGTLYSRGRVMLIPNRKPYPPLHTLKRDTRNTFIEFEYPQSLNTPHKVAWTASDTIIVYPKTATVFHKQESISFQGKTYRIKYSTDPLPQ
jgi:hypothetical protein